MARYKVNRLLTFVYYDNNNIYIMPSCYMCDTQSHYFDKILLIISLTCKRINKNDRTNQRASERTNERMNVCTNVYAWESVCVCVGKGGFAFTSFIHSFILTDWLRSDINRNESEWNGIKRDREKTTKRYGNGRKENRLKSTFHKNDFDSIDRCIGRLNLTLHWTEFQTK